MRFGRLAAAVCALGVVAGAAYAQSPESLAWLRKIQDATRNLSYNGTIAPGTTLSSAPGFLGTWSGTNAVPTSFKLNGVTCAIV